MFCSMYPFLRRNLSLVLLSIVLHKNSGSENDYCKYTLSCAFLQYEQLYKKKLNYLIIQYVTVTAEE